MQHLRAPTRCYHIQAHQRVHLATCRVLGLGSVPSALWERAVSFGRSLRQFGVPGTDVQYRTDAETAQAEHTGGRAAEGQGRVLAVESTEGGSSNSSSSSSSSNGGSSSSSSSSSGLRTGRAPLKLEVRVVDSISQVPREEWDAVVSSCAGGEVNPFLLWSFMHALEESGSAARRTGWLAQHIVVREVGSDDGDSEGGGGAEGAAGGGGGRGRLVGCVPMYLKGHSYGEYVFDSSWADFAGMLGIRYYPKLQAAVPFTPVTGPRILVSAVLAPADRAAVVRTLGRTLIDMAESMGVSGVHLTFTTAQEWAVLAELGFKQRLGMQFHWENAGYDSFDSFLGDLKQSKRKNIRQERKSIERAGLSVHRLPGAALSAAHWDRFYSFYTSTVDRKWGNAYLTREFFQRLGEDMPDRVLMVAASEAPLASYPTSASSDGGPAAGDMVAAALNLVGSHALFGRNWGQADGRDYRNLHFELCYYQALDEAIARRLPRVEAGAQGEHKLQRGYLPSFTYSCHYIRDPRLGAAVDKFLERERGQIEYAVQMMSVTGSPYKKERTVEALITKLRAYKSLSSGSSVDADGDGIVLPDSSFIM